MKRALLLSGSLGAGHEMHARACVASLAERGWATDTVEHDVQWNAAGTVFGCFR